MVEIYNLVGKEIDRSISQEVSTARLCSPKLSPWVNVSDRLRQSQNKILEYVVMQEDFIVESRILVELSKNRYRKYLD